MPISLQDPCLTNLPKIDVINPNPAPKQVSCFKPDWCRIPDKYLIDLGACVGESLSVLQRETMLAAINYGKLGQKKQVNSLYLRLNKLQHFAALLFAISVQIHFNKTDTFDNYITCDEILCIKREWACQGIDITCLLECFNNCGYTNDCKRCT